MWCEGARRSLLDDQNTCADCGEVFETIHFKRSHARVHTEVLYA